MVQFRAALCLVLVSALLGIAPPISAHPLGELIELTMKLAGRVGTASHIPFDVRAARIATDRAFRDTLFKELEQTGNRAMAEKLAQAWERADTPAYQEAILRDVQILKTIKSVGILLPENAPAGAQEDIASIVSSLIEDSLGDVPISAFASDKALQEALTKAVSDRAAAQAKSPDAKFSFEVSSGKLTVPLKTELIGIEIKAGEINLYKVIGTTVALIVCKGIKCVEDTVLALFKEDGEKSKRETPAQSNERLRRLARDAANADDPLRSFLVSVRAESAETRLDR
jgi:hypothetical protein